MVSFPTYLLALPLVLGPTIADQACPRIPGIQIYATTPDEGLSDVKLTSCDNGFDSPKVQAGNASSYDWWYFDAIGTDGVSSLAVAYFVEANKTGFSVTENFTNQDFVQISGTFPNGTTFADFLFADNAIVSAMGDGSSGLWNGTGASWAGSPDLSDYLITLDANHLGYGGPFSMHSVSGLWFHHSVRDRTLICVRCRSLRLTTLALLSAQTKPWRFFPAWAGPTLSPTPT